ncbi:unnamed protein product, partial [Rangifer tarandus platyrhynchus]
LGRQKKQHPEKGSRHGVHARSRRGSPTPKTQGVQAGALSWGLPAPSLSGSPAPPPQLTATPHSPRGGSPNLQPHPQANPHRRLHRPLPRCQLREARAPLAVAGGSASQMVEDLPPELSPEDAGEVALDPRS